MAKKRRKKKSSAKRRKKRKVVKSAAKKVRRKKRRSKKSAAPKAAKKSRRRRRKSRKAKKAVAVKATKRKSRRRKSRRSKMVTVKGSFKGRFRRNPIGGGSMGKGLRVAGHLVSGYDLLEVGALALGGATYGAINGALPKIPVLGQVQAALMKVPVVGTALTPMVVGMALNVAADKFIKSAELKKYVSMLGDGLVGAAVVGMGVNASQFVPFLSPNMSGLGNVQYTPGGRDTLGNVQYFPGMGIMPQGLGSNPDFGGVNYTPNLSGMGDVEYFPGMGADADFGSNPDFGASADFGITPEGLGSEGDYAEQMS